MPDILQSSARIVVRGTPLTLHYRLAGTGPCLFLLHPSPFSSAFMAPLMARLADRACLIAPDTLGFGASDPLPGEVDDLSPYVEAMVALRRALGLDRIAVYGSATGAQIAVEWAKADADAVTGVMLDNAATFTDAERAHITRGYFPDLKPRADGRHLAAAWQAVHDGTLFFPWQQPAAAHRIAPDLGPPAAMDAAARAYLEAGPDYQKAYRAAFRNERGERVQPIEAPLVILRWQGSILKRWTDHLDRLAWGDNVTMAFSGPSQEDRWPCLEAHLPRILAGDAPRQADSLVLDTGQIRYAAGGVRYRMPPAGVPDSIAIHGFGGAGELLDPMPGAVRVDLPGHGGSAPASEVDSQAAADEARRCLLAECVDGVCGVMAELGLEGAPIHVVDTAHAIAQGVAARQPGSAVQALPYPGWRGPLPPLEPDAGGGHLWRAWHWLRAQYLKRDMPPPDPARLGRMMLRLLDAQDAYRLMMN